ncbi:transglutaminase family protein [Muricauda sp. SCSIO 64092]|uniref:transglutaminase-like domain-containing protein n=1 Tax=Allomuricauda sp. SCSIO 64092 TaxID=2908842 RepID=UPI001FF1C0C7|nr:transglutaminase family protein [Muricauda sp. SCSIO 64092]UOY06633.1 transglutaminase family protein [Muricauda sp. SCSIO 64092]
MEYIKATTYLDYDSAAIQDLISPFTSEELSPMEKAKGMYLVIRDRWRYNPYQISLNPENYRASTIAKKSEGHCVEKAVLLTACLRGLGIPARLHFAKVTNHIAVERLTERFGTNILTPHGMVDVFLDNQWVKATPAFNKALCDKCNVKPLEFDGTTDSIFQEYNEEGQKFMEYLEDYGHFEDVPLDFMIQNLREHYPEIFDLDNGIVEYRF